MPINTFSNPLTRETPATLRAVVPRSCRPRSAAVGVAAGATGHVRTWWSRLALVALSFAIAIQVALANPASADATPVAVVEHLHETLLEAMRQGPELGYAGRVELLQPVIHASFDFATIAGIVTGRAWKSVSVQQRRDFLDVFTRLSVATYATNFSDFGDEKFVTDDSEESRGARIVRSHLERSDGSPVSLNYMLRESDDGWRIINVVAQGVSDLSLKRAEYTAVIESEGFDSLLERLRGKLQELE